MSNELDECCSGNEGLGGGGNCNAQTSWNVNVTNASFPVTNGSVITIPSGTLYVPLEIIITFNLYCPTLDDVVHQHQKLDGVQTCSACYWWFCQIAGEDGAVTYTNTSYNGSNNNLFALATADCGSRPVPTQESIDMRTQNISGNAMRIGPNESLLIQAVATLPNSSGKCVYGSQTMATLFTCSAVQGS